MAIGVTDPGVDTADTSAGTSYSTAAWTAPSSSLIVVFVLSTHASPVADPSSVTHDGTSLSKITSVDNSTTNARLGMYVMDSGGSPGSSVTNASYGVNQNGVIIMPFAMTGVDLSGGASAAVVQSPTNSAASGTSLSITLSAAGASDNRPISCFNHDIAEAMTEQTSWTEIGDITLLTPDKGMNTQWRSDTFDTAAAASWSTSASSRPIGIAAEIKATAAGGSITTMTIVTGGF